MTNTPWAILLCRFNDTNNVNLNINLANQLFTNAGDQTFNMTRYFRENSHGNVDLTGSQVFPTTPPYITVNLPASSYVAPSDPPPPGWMQSVTRDELIQQVAVAATAAGVPLGGFFGICAIFNEAIGITFGGGSTVGPFCVSDYRWLNSNGTASHAHEFGHAYGMNHSRRAGSTDDYRDPWDIMSARATFLARDPTYGERGPGLNAANMKVMNWLSTSRIWHGPETGFDTIIPLRPLHRRDLPGMLAIEFPGAWGSDGLTVEYRKRVDWDSAIPRSAVFVHSRYLGTSYLESSTAGHPDMIKGDIFEKAGSPLAPSYHVEVIEIADGSDTALVRVAYEPGEPIPGDWHGIPSYVVGQTRADGPGWRWNGRRFVPIPPWNPMAAVIATLDEWFSASDIREPRLRNQALRSVVGRMKSELDTVAAELDPIRVPAPPLPTNKPAKPRQRAMPRKTAKKQ
jgi:hypothetical protein